MCKLQVRTHVALHHELVVYISSSESVSMRVSTCLLAVVLTSSVAGRPTHVKDMWGNRYIHGPDHRKGEGDDVHEENSHGGAATTNHQANSNPGAAVNQQAVSNAETSPSQQTVQGGMFSPPGNPFLVSQAAGDGQHAGEQPMPDYHFHQTPTPQTPNQQTEGTITSSGETPQQEVNHGSQPNQVKMEPSNRGLRRQPAVVPAEQNTHGQTTAPGQNVPQWNNNPGLIVPFPGTQGGSTQGLTTTQGQNTHGATTPGESTTSPNQGTHGGTNHGETTPGGTTTPNQNTHGGETNHGRQESHGAGTEHGGSTPSNQNPERANRDGNIITRPETLFSLALLSGGALAVKNHRRIAEALLTPPSGEGEAPITPKNVGDTRQRTFPAMFNNNNNNNNKKKLSPQSTPDQSTQGGTQAGAKAATNPNTKTGATSSKGAKNPNTKAGATSSNGNAPPKSPPQPLTDPALAWKQQTYEWHDLVKQGKHNEADNLLRRIKLDSDLEERVRRCMMREVS